MHSWYEDRKETYQGPIPKIEYQTGKDAVAVGTFVATGGLATISKIKKGTDFVEGLVTTVKKSDFEKKLLTKEGKFIDNLLEIDYEKYLKRKTTQGKPPKDRTNWKEARDYWLYDSPLARGNAFNLKAEDYEWYQFNEIHLETGKRLDSYVPPKNGNIGEIISRKATSLEEIEFSTFESYLKEMKTKYSEGTKIRSNKYPDLDGDLLQGKQILEIPSSNQDFKEIQKYIDLAKNKYNIDIRFKPE